MYEKTSSFIHKTFAGSKVRQEKIDEKYKTKKTETERVKKVLSI